jgi:hypothetical protein
MKEALAAVLAGFQGLGSDESRERPVDRLAALGQIQNSYADTTAANSFLASLGVSLISFKYANRPASKQDAEDQLAIALSWKQWNLRLTGKERDKVARQALMEWAIDFCPTCHGRKEVPEQGQQEGPQRMKPCMSCTSTGKRRYSDHERVEAMGKAFDKAMSVAHGIIGRAEDLSVRAAKDMLERW